MRSRNFVPLSTWTGSHGSLSTYVFVLSIPNLPETRDIDLLVDPGISMALWVWTLDSESAIPITLHNVSRWVVLVAHTGEPL
jgi:hypothetical protein